MKQITCCDCGTTWEAKTHGKAPRRCEACRVEHVRRYNREVWARQQAAKPPKQCHDCGTELPISAVPARRDGNTRCRPCYKEFCRTARKRRKPVNRGPMEGRTCIGCGKTFDASNQIHVYCDSECAAASNRAKPKPMEHANCLHCDKGFEREIRGIHRGGLRVYCSTTCQYEAKSFRYMKKRSMPIPWAGCPTCGDRFIKRGTTKRCRSCATKPAVRIAIVYSKVCSCPGCGVRYETAQPHQKTCSKKCAERRSRITFRERHGRQDTHRKRARLYGCEYEPVSRTKVFERDNYTCQICGESTSTKYSFDDPWSPTIDHIIPMSKQGGHTYDNVQCAHAWCNSVKNDGRSGVDPAEMLGADLARALR